MRRTELLRLTLRSIPKALLTLFALYLALAIYIHCLPPTSDLFHARFQLDPKYHSPGLHRTPGSNAPPQKSPPHQPVLESSHSLPSSDPSASDATSIPAHDRTHHNVPHPPAPVDFNLTSPHPSDSDPNYSAKGALLSLPAPVPPTRTTFLPGAHNLNSEFRVWFWEPWRRIRDRHRYSHSRDRGVLEVLSIVAPSGVGGYRIYHPWDKKSAVGKGVEGEGKGNEGEGTAVGGRWSRGRWSDRNSSRGRKGNAGPDVLWQRYLEGSIVLNSASAYDTILPQLRSQPPQSCYLIACAVS
ncbi:hypothetical protein DFP72DRAFT_613631 [Ephemerocybe angulata]|uniref:Uncharacterized protein n=1 Tax=Ephemerocybe angulata TaxID=980116 RepID=A0A8H6LZX0_9AGAR|nr:hypothetical protein DFP72DRAFT_613631 [Tulosesus angulatus]